MLRRGTHRASKSYGDYNWEELLLSEGLNSLYVLELDLYLKNRDDEGDDTVLGETWSEETESEQRECEEGDESEFEPLTKRPCSTRSGRHTSSFILQFCINILSK